MSTPFRISARSGGGYAPCPPGNWPGAVAALIDLGWQSHNFAGDVRESHDVYVVFEVEVETDGAVERFHVARSYRWSMHAKSALRGLVTRLLGSISDDDEVNVDDVLGKGCLVEVVNEESRNGRPYAKIAGVTALPRGMKTLELTHRPFARATDDPQPVPLWLPYLYGKKLSDVINVARTAMPAAGNHEEKLV
jgi:hypothetical protein